MSRDPSPAEVLEYLVADTVVRAGAGTGKTHSLTSVVLHLLGGLTSLREPVSPEEITAVTFTEAAAVEMRERIQTRVAGLAMADGGAVSAPGSEAERDRAALRRAAAELGVELPAAEFWRRLLPRLDRLRATTFHGWAYGILRAHAPAAGLDPALEVLDENQSREFWRTLVEEILLEDLERPDSSALRLVRHYGYGRSDAQGGSLAGWILGLVQALREEGGDASRLTEGGRYDADEVRHRLTESVASLRGALRRIGALAPQATAAKRARVEQMGTMAAAEALWGEERLAETLEQIKSSVAGRWGNARSPLFAPRAEVKTLLERCHRTHADLLAAPLVAALQQIVTRILQRAAERKAAAGRVDFADMLLLAGQLLRSNAAVRRREREACRILLVDEFQDTNRVQAELVAAVSDPADPRRRRFLVGDPKQSIYAFRGADVAVYERAIRDALGAGAREHPLQRSWRSRPALLEFINRVSVAIFAGSEGDAPPDFAVRYLPQRDELLPVRLGPPAQARSPVDLLQVDVEGVAAAQARAREFRALAHYLRRVVAGECGIEIRAAGAPGEAEQVRTPRFGDIAILLRTFTHINALLRELDLAGVPALLLKGEGFDQAPEVRDLVLYLCAACDWDDAIAFAAALRSPLVGLRDATLARMAAPAGRGRTLDTRQPGLKPRFWWQGSRTAESDWPPEEQRRLQRFLRTGRWLHRRRARLEPATALEVVLEWTGFEAFQIARGNGLQAVANIRELVAAARREVAAGGDLLSFLRQASRRLRNPTRTPPADLERAAGDQVQVITVHSSKGLQFPLVVLADMGTSTPSRGDVAVLDRDVGFGLRLRPHRDGPLDHTIWSERALDALRARELEESRRLFYVAMTRAEDQLLLLGQGRGREHWRAWIDPLVADLEAAGLLRVVALCPEELPGAAAVEAAGELPWDVDYAAQVATTSAVVAPTELPRDGASVPLEITTTGLEMLLQCPRLYRLRAVLGWEAAHPAVRTLGHNAEEPWPRQAREAAIAPLRGDGAAQTLGTLTHAILERVDLTRGVVDPRAAIDAVLPELASGDPDLLPRAADRAAALLSSSVGREIAAAAAVEREVDFRLLLPPRGSGPPLLLRGRIDLLLRAADGSLRIIDYKSGSSAAADPQRHAEQLRLYALALENTPGSAAALASDSRAASSAMPSSTYLCYLGDTPPRLLPVPPDPSLPERISEALGGLLDWERERSWPGRSRSFCRRIGCGFVNGCHP
jgi:ATP-dependent exoDNAse (exonuclease V) beta subunit